MKVKRHSIKDIAEKLNVSITTVSFVLNGKAKEKRISNEVAQKILEYSKEIGYKPNHLAKSLRTGKSKIIVLMVEDISNQFFARLARIVEDLAHEKGYKMLFCSNDNNDSKSAELIKIFKERQVDGFIVIPTVGIRQQIKNLMDDNIPVVLFDRYFPDLRTPYVGIDNEDAAYKSTNHLIQNSYDQIALITTDVEQTQMMARQKGYEKAIFENKLNSYILKVPYTSKTEVRKSKIIKFLELYPEIDALFFATNYLTREGLLALKEYYPKRKIEIGIVTFDDNILYEVFTPSITAVYQPLEAIAEELMKMMLKIIKGDLQSKKLTEVILKAELCIRDSSLPSSKKLKY